MLHKAVGSKDVKEVCKLLKIQYINVNERDRTMQTPLHVAATHKDNTRIFEMLIGKKGVDPNATDKSSYTPLHVACSECNIFAINELLDHPKIDVKAYFFVYSQIINNCINCVGNKNKCSRQ